MPVNGPSKVESKCLSMCGRVEPFTSLGSGRREMKVPQNFWQELASDHGAVSNFMVCLVARLISLDSSHGLDPLVSVYRDLVELPVEHAKYRVWSNKHLPPNLKPAALELQHSIIATIYFLTKFYSYNPTIHLRHIYLRWNLARNYSGDGSKLADTFEEKVMCPFSVAQSKDTVIHPPHTQLSLGETLDSKVLAQLVDHCCQNHRRAQFGTPPPQVTKLCVYSSVSEGLAYVALQDLMTRSLLVGSHTLRHVLLALGNLAVHGQASTEQGDREDLLPLLQLLRDLVTMLIPVDGGEAYKAVMPFYMWPVAHAECSRRILGLLTEEGKILGTSFRRKLLVEGNLGLKLRNTEIRGQFVHMLIDVSTPGCHGNQFADVFTNRHDLLTSETLHRMIIRSCFKSIFPTRDVSELQTCLKRLSTKSLVGVASECVELMEGAVTRDEADFLDGIPEEVVAEMNKIHQKIIEETDAGGQGDSAVSENSSSQHLSEEGDLGVFALPHPDIPTHTLDPCKYPLVQAKLREVLVQCQKQLSPTPVGHRTLSQTSMDSTGSSHMETDTRTVRHNHLQEPSAAEEAESVIETSGGVVRANGHCGQEEEEEDGENHAASPDSGHVRSPDPVTSFSLPSALEEMQVVKKRRSNSTEIAPTSFHSRELNGDSPGSSDEIFNKSPNSQGSLSSDHSSPQSRGRGGVAKLTRRQTVPAKLHPKKSRGTSIISHAPSIWTAHKGYTNLGGTPTISLATIPLKTKVPLGRKGSISLPKKKKVAPLAGAGSPIHANSPKLRVLKIMLAGNDQLVCHAAKAYAHLLTEEPNLFTGLDVRFYHVPLSCATTADWMAPERNTATSSGRDSPETVVGELTNSCGLDVNIGRFMSHLDSWYERNVALAVHHSLRVLPPISGQSLSPSQTDTQHTRPPLTPAKILVDSVTHYLRDANHCLKAKLYKIKMVLRSEKLHKMENREIFMLHKFDVQRLTGKKSNRQAKPFEMNLEMTELSLDGSFVRADVMSVKDVWSVQATNIPSSSDQTVANPELECFELSVSTAHAEGGRFTKTRLMEQTSYHTHSLILETKKDPLTVMVDGDTDSLIDNVIRLEVAPAYLGLAPPTLSQAPPTESRSDKQLFLPLMTFWPIDL